MAITATFERERTDSAQLRVSVVDFLALSSRHQEALLRELCAVDRAVFAGAARSDLEPYLRDPDAWGVWIVLYRDGGRLVGQNIIPIVRHEVSGRTVAVVNSIAGMLPEYRGSGRMQLDAGQVLLAFKARHPFTPTFGATALLHPRVYALFAGRCSQVWPRPKVPTPPKMEAVLAAVAARDGTFRSISSGVYVQSDLPPPRSTHAERRRSSALDGPLTRYFTAQVPGYGDGEALLCVMPISLWTMAELGLRAAWSRWGGQ